MATPVLFDDFADKSGILEAIKQLTKANEDWAITSINQNNRVIESNKEVVKGLLILKDTIASIAPKGDSGATQVKQLSDQAKEAIGSFKDYNTVIAANQNLLRSNASVIQQMTDRLAALEKESADLNTTTKEGTKRQNEIGREMRQTTTVLKGLASTTEQATKATNAAEGSYRALDLQTKKLRQDLKEMSDAFVGNTGEINKNNAVAVEMARRIAINDVALKKMDATMGVHNRNVGNYSSVLKDAAGQLVGFTSVAGAAVAIVAALKQAFDIVQQMDAYDASLRAVSRDTADFNRSQQYLIGLADKTGFTFGTLIGNYNKLKAATKDTVLEGRATEKIFSAVSIAGAKLSLDNETITGTLKALTDMISKGTVQAEELKGQLGDRLPGAMRLLQEALGVSSSELQKMMKNGDLLATEILPKLATQLGITYGLKQNENIETIGASIGRITTQVQLLIKAVADNTGVRDFFNAIAGGLNTSLGDIRRWVQDGSVKEFFTFFGAGSLSRRNQARRDTEDALNRGGNTDTAGREKQIEEIQQRELEAYRKGDIDTFNELAVLRRKLIRQNRQLNISETEQAVRDQGIKEKDAIAKNQTDITRFQKQSAIKRSAEIIALEKQLAKKEGDTTLTAKLDLYRRLDTEQTKLDKEAKDRVKSNKGVNADTALRNNLSNAAAGTGVKLAGLDADRQDGLINEATFLKRRQEITLAGIAERQAILKAAGKKETDDYKDTISEKLAAETQYKRDRLKLALNDSKGSTANAVAGVNDDQASGVLTEREGIEKRYAITVAGIRERQIILAQANQQESQLYKDTETEILEATKTYHKEQLTADRHEWETQLRELEAYLNETDKLIGDNLTKRLSTIKQAYEKEKTAVEIGIMNGSISEEEGDRRLHNLKLRYIQDELRATLAAYDTEQQAVESEYSARIAGLEAIVNDETKSIAERKAAEQEILKLRVAEEKRIAKIRAGIIDAEASAADDTTKDDNDNEKTKNEKRLIKIKQVTEAGLQLIGSIGSAIYDADNQRLNDQLTAIEKQKQAELDAVGNNEAAKAAIEKKYDDQRKQIQHQQDVQARQKATFEAIISTALAVVKALPNPVLAAIAAGLGLAQIAIIQSAPYPKYKEGKNVGSLDRYEGKAIAGEAGRELHFKENGDVALYDKETVIDVKKNDVIAPNHLTEQLLSDKNAIEANRLLHRNQRSAMDLQSANRNKESYQRGNLKIAFPIKQMGKELKEAVGSITLNQLGTNQKEFISTITTVQNASQKMRSKHQLTKK